MDRREDAGEVYPGGGFAPTSGGARPDAIAELAAEVEELAGEVEDRPTKAQIDEGWWSEWELSGSRYDPNVTYTITYGSGIWEVNNTVDHWGEHAPADATYINFRDGELIITRHRVAAPVPTKPSDIGAESQSNKVTSISQYSTNSQYPSAKCVYDIVGNIESALAAINGGSAS